MMYRPMLLLLSSLLLLSEVEAVTVNGFEASFYGFIKTSLNFADAGLASFNNINETAPTRAVPQTRAQDKVSRLSFQAQQSRLGTIISKNQVTGKLEFDFIDFNKSSPTTQMVPRVRVATISYNWDNKKIIMGQDWDMYSPVNTFSFNLIGNYFEAGNAGFMRQQFQYLETRNDWEFGAALGMAGNNPGTGDQNLELGKTPTYVVRLSRKLSQGRFGASLIYTTLDWQLENNVRRDVYGHNLFYEDKLGDFQLRSEFYYGQNLNNTGALSLGRGTSTTNVKEWGGFITGAYIFNEIKSFFGGLGLAKADEKSELPPFAFSTTTPGLITAPGISSNFVSRLGYDYKMTSDLSWISELSRFETTSKLDPNRYKTFIVYGIESGLLLKF